MFTVVAIALGTVLAWYAGRKNEEDRRDYVLSRASRA